MAEATATAACDLVILIVDDGVSIAVTKRKKTVAKRPIPEEKREARCGKKKRIKVGFLNTFEIGGLQR